MLLNAWGWSEMARYSLYGAIGLTLAAVVVLGAFCFELVLATRRVVAPQSKARTV